MTDNFHCHEYGLDIPADKQRSFCAVQFRRERLICIDCDKGREADQEERDMPEITKTCKCGKEYKAKGPAAKYCDDCKAAKASGGGQKKDKKQKPTRKASAAPRKGNGKTSMAAPESHESVKVLETLIAIGAVSQAKVDATRKYIKEMLA